MQEEAGSARPEGAQAEILRQVRMFWPRPVRTHHKSLIV